VVVVFRFIETIRRWYVDHSSLYVYIYHVPFSNLLFVGLSNLRRGSRGKNRDRQYIYLGALDERGVTVAELRAGNESRREVNTK
jgi:hypothetical protein